MKFIFSLSFLIILTACFNGSDNKSVEEGSKQSDIELPQESYSSTSYDEIGWELMEKEQFGVLKIGMKDSEIVALIGEPKIQSEVEFWEATALYMQAWNYPDKGVEIHLSGDTEIPNTIEMLKIGEGSSLKTTRRIGIGSTEAQVKTAYASAIDPDLSSTESIVAGSYYGGLIFQLENGKVTSIFLGAAAE